MVTGRQFGKTILRETEGTKPGRLCVRSLEGITLKIQQSAEDYLETILMLSYRKPMIRSIDVVNELGVFKTKRQRCDEESS